MNKGNTPELFPSTDLDSLVDEYKKTEQELQALADAIVKAATSKNQSSAGIVSEETQTQEDTHRGGRPPVRRHVEQEGGGSRGGFAAYALDVLSDGKKRKLSEVYEEVCEAGWQSQAKDKETAKKGAYGQLLKLREGGKVKHRDRLYWLDKR